MTSETPPLAERMKATLYCLLLSDFGQKEDMLRTYLITVLNQQTHNAVPIFEFCCKFLAINDPEFTFCDDVICDVLRLVGCSEQMSDRQVSALLTNQQVNNALLKTSIRDRFPGLGGTPLREAIARDTLQLLRVKEFWKVSQFSPLMRNVGRFESLEEQFVNTLFDILFTYKVAAEKSKSHYESTTNLTELARVWMLQNQNRIVVRKRLILNQLYERILEKSKRGFLIFET